MQRGALQPYFLISIIAGALLLGFFIVEPFLTPVALAAIFAVVLQPLYQFYVRKLGGFESFASVCTVITFTLLVLLPASIIASQLIGEAQDLYAKVSKGGVEAAYGTALTRAEDLAARYAPDAHSSIAAFRENINTYASQALTWIGQHLGRVFSGVVTLFLSTFIFFISLYYLVRDGEKLSRWLIELSPLSDSDDSTILRRLEQAVNSVVRGQFVVALTQGTLTGIGLALFGVPNALLWGLVAAIAALVPSIGTALVIAPAVLYLALIGSYTAAIGLLAWGVVAVGLVDNLLGPKLISSGLKLHPLLIILAVLGGLIFFGPVGIFLGPITMSLLIVLLSIYPEVVRRSG